MGAIATTWLQLVLCVGVARRRHRALHKNLKPESNSHKQDPRLIEEVGDLRVAILTNQIGLLFLSVFTCIYELDDLSCLGFLINSM